MPSVRCVCVCRYGHYAAHPDSMSIGRYIYTYASVMGAHLISTAMRAFLWAYTTVRTANIIHDNAVSTVLRCPTAFFDTTCVDPDCAVPCRCGALCLKRAGLQMAGLRKPECVASCDSCELCVCVCVCVCVPCSPNGRIMNRVSKDQNEVDMRLPFMWQFVANMFLQILTTIGVIGYSAPWFLLAILPVAIFCACHPRLRRAPACLWLLCPLQTGCCACTTARPPCKCSASTPCPSLPCSRCTRKPWVRACMRVSDHEVPSLGVGAGGLDTIRAYRLHNLFRSRFHYLADYTTTASKYLVASTGWLRMRLVHISLLLVSACAFFVVGLR